MSTHAQVQIKLGKDGRGGALYETCPLLLSSNILKY
jgi:hypothetical protein